MIRLRTLFFLSGLLFLISACESFTGDNNSDGDDEERIEYRYEMVSFISELKSKALEQDSDFYLIAQNGERLVTQTGVIPQEGTINQTYMDAIDGISRESLFYGYPDFDQPTDPSYQQNFLSFLDYIRNQGKKAMVVDYTSTYRKQVESYNSASARNYISFAAPDIALNTVPTNYIHNENFYSVSALSQAQNFLYVINTIDFSSKQNFLSALHNTNYDLIIIDPAFHWEDPFTAEEIQSLKAKTNGAQRLVFAHMNIGEAEMYRYYWKEEWMDDTPDWISVVSSDSNKSRYPVQYWNDEWKEIIYRSDDSYLNRILQAGFDGIYLDEVTSFYRFEG